jgi:hypothetical protein
VRGAHWAPGQRPQVRTWGCPLGTTLGTHVAHVLWCPQGLVYRHRGGVPPGCPRVLGRPAAGRVAPRVMMGPAAASEASQSQRRAGMRTPCIIGRALCGGWVACRGWCGGGAWGVKHARTFALVGVFPLGVSRGGRSDKSTARCPSASLLPRKIPLRPGVATRAGESTGGGGRVVDGGPHCCCIPAPETVVSLPQAAPPCTSGTPTMALSAPS